MAYAIEHPNGPACTCERVQQHTDSTLSQFVSSAGRAIWLAAERRAQRRMLVELDERQLKDIGITREQAARESDKSFWE